MTQFICIRQGKDGKGRKEIKPLPVLRETFILLLSPSFFFGGGGKLKGNSFMILKVVVFLAWQS